MELTLEGVERPTGAELDRIRQDGVADGFTALNTADGFRQDGTLWFGDCSVCGERVFNSWRDGVWTHTKRVTVSRHADGSPLQQTSTQFAYCPTERGEA
jgi:hypothetical protein